MKKIFRSVLFTGIAEEAFPAMLHCLGAVERQYQKEQYIWTVDDPAGKIGVVLEGSVMLFREDFWGNRSILSKVQEGELFGEAFSCAGEARLSINVVAAEDCRILFLYHEKIVTTCTSACRFHTRLIENMMRILAKKNMMLTQKMDVMAKRTTREKLLAYLSAEAALQQNNSFKIPFNRQELADYLAVDRSAMSRELSRLKQEGVLDYEKNYFFLRNNS